MNLFELQKAFVNALDQQSTQIFDVIQTHALTATAHFAIYKNSILGAQQNALKAIYPVCVKLVGEDFFIYMANHYIAKHASCSPDLNDYGKYFSEFIKTFSPANDLPYLPDVATLEWAWDKIDRMSTQFSSPYPVHHIWETNQDNFVGDDTIVLIENQVYFYRVWREGEMRKIEVQQ